MRRRLSFLLAALLLTALPLTAGVDDLLPRPKIIKLGKGNSLRPKVEVRYVADIPGVERNQNEAYRLKVGKFGVVIEAETDHGVWNALQTLAQLYDGDALPVCTITDWPSFRIRGVMMDVGRTWMSL